MTPSHLRSLAPVLLTALLGCDPGSDPSSSGGGSSGGGSSSGVYDFCANETRADPWSIGLQKMGKQVTVTIADAKPAAPVRGDNNWLLQIEDMSGSPMNGMTLETSPRMPDHGHGTPVPAITTAMGDGEYQVTPINLWMAGYWEVTFNLTLPDGGGTDSVMFGVCVE